MSLVSVSSSVNRFPVLKCPSYVVAIFGLSDRVDYLRRSGLFTDQERSPRILISDCTTPLSVSLIPYSLAGYEGNLSTFYYLSAFDVAAAGTAQDSKIPADKITSRSTPRNPLVKQTGPFCLAFRRLIGEASRVRTPRRALLKGETKLTVSRMQPPFRVDLC